MFETVRPLSKTLSNPQKITLSFKNGIPHKLNQKKISPIDLFKNLNLIAGKHGIGVVDIVENRFVGMKSRGVYETPAGTVLNLAHRAIESLTMDREVMHIRDSLIPKVSQLIYNGFWYSPEMNSILAFVNETQKNVTGDVKILLYKGNVRILGRRSDYSLYSNQLATFEEDNLYDQSDATGFIKLNSLRLILNKLK